MWSRVLRAGLCSLGIKQTQLCLVCFIPKEHSIIVRSTIKYNYNFDFRVLFFFTESKILLPQHTWNIFISSIIFWIKVYRPTIKSEIKGDGKINLADAMSGVFAYISATMPWILQRKVSNWRISILLLTYKFERMQKAI